MLKYLKLKDLIKLKLVSKDADNICDANLLKDEFENEESNNQNEPT